MAPGPRDHAAHRSAFLPPLPADEPAVPAWTAAGQAAMDAAQALGRKAAAAAATLRAYNADWTDFARWCTAHGFTPVPAAPALREKRTGHKALATCQPVPDNAFRGPAGAHAQPPATAGGRQPP